MIEEFINEIDTCVKKTEVQEKELINIDLQVVAR